MNQAIDTIGRICVLIILVWLVFRVTGIGGF